MAWSPPPLGGSGTALIVSHNRPVDRRVLVVGIHRQQGEYRGRHTARGRTAEAPMVVVPIAEDFRQVTPGDAGAVAVEHRVHETAVVRRCYPRGTGSAGKLVLDTVPFVIA
jgi:hypothetical protein